MRRLTDLFAGRSVGSFVERARRRMGSGKLSEAARILERGLERYPTASSLLELRLSLRRAQAHESIRDLEQRINEENEPRAFELLIDLYQSLELPEEARRRALAYVEQYPDRDSPHLILGASYLDSFFDELRARHGHEAHDHLVQAASLNTQALQPRLLLAELYFCIGATNALKVMMQAAKRMAPESESVETAAAVVEQLADSTGEDKLDGTFERIENQGHLDRAPEDWPLSKRQRRSTRIEEENSDPAVIEMIESGLVDELVLLRRDGSVITHATPTGLRSEDPEEAADATSQGAGLVDVARTVASRVFPQAREFDLGRFSRCTIQGRFGNIVIGRVGSVQAGARGPSSVEPLRLWHHVCLQLDSAAEGGTP